MGGYNGFRINEDKLMVKASKEFKDYRCQVLGLQKKDFRDLQAGKAVKVDDKILKKYPQCFIKEKK